MYNQQTGVGVAEINGANAEGNARFAPRVDGNFTGTTDEIIQWASCKWGIDEDVVRAIAVWHSWWYQWFTSHDGRNFGLMSINADVHAGTHPASMSSTAFNLDYALAWHRSCYDGYFGWVPAEARGDLWGCVGLWFSGSWKNAAANDYVAAVQLLNDAKVWRNSDF